MIIEKMIILIRKKTILVDVKKCSLQTVWMHPKSLEEIHFQ